jgi:hypothetical protein
MSGTSGSGHAVSGLALVLTMTWAFFVWAQPVEQVASTMNQEYQTSPVFIRRWVEPMLEPAQLFDQQDSGRTSRALGVTPEKFNLVKALYVNLMWVRFAEFAAVCVVGLPLILAAWQMGKACQRSRFRKGTPPSPNWQTCGWVLKTCGLIVLPMSLAPLVCVTVQSFGWIGAAGAGAGAMGAFILGMHSRRG